MPLIQTLLSTSRRVLRRPVSACGIVLTLTLGIAISVGMFSVLHGVVLRALPYPDADRVVLIYSENLEQGALRGSLTPAEASEGLENVPGFEHTAFFAWGGQTFIGDDAPRTVTTLSVSGGYFSVFDMPAALGRTLVEADVAENRSVVVLTHAGWVDLTGGDPTAIGRTLTFRDGRFEIVGVLPESFAHQTPPPTMYRPFPSAMLNVGNPAYSNARYLSAVGRLSAGASPALADEGLQAHLTRVKETHGLPERGWRLRQLPLIDNLIGDVRKLLFALFAVTLLVLLIACATTASLVSIRLEQRKSEIAVRRALGASHGRVALDVAVELLLLAGLAAVGGVLLAHLMVGAIQPLADGNLPRADGVEIDAAALTFAAFATVCCVLLSGGMPLMRALREATVESLRGGMARQVEGGRRVALVPAVGVGLSTIALVTALALAMSLIQLGNVNAGFRTDNIAGFQIFRNSASEIPGFVDRAFEELRGLSVVREVVAASPTPFYPIGGMETDADLPDRELIEPIRTSVVSASPGYHRFLGISILSGRSISERDAQGMPNVAVINETFARRAFGGADAVGQRLTVSIYGQPTPFEVVGVAADIRNAGLRTPTEPQIVVSVYQQPLQAITLLIESAVPLSSAMEALAQAVQRVDPSQAINRRFTLAADLDAQMHDARFFAAATGWFGVLALLLGAAGINAVVAATQRRRTREIGLRLALGAAPRHAAALVLSNAARIVAVGLGAGALLAVPAFVWLRDQLFAVGTGAFAGLFVLTALVLAVAGLAAAGWPAWRATRVAPMQALRYE